MLREFPRDTGCNDRRRLRMRQVIDVYVDVIEETAMNIDHYVIQDGRRQAHAWDGDGLVWVLRLIEPSRATAAGERPQIEYAEYDEDDFSSPTARVDAVGSQVMDWPCGDDFREVFDGSGREDELECLWDELLTAFFQESTPDDAVAAWATANGLPRPW
jgi:hypothetical protein